ncbi:hypothetical protein CR513_36901, partial [Mucuna pruriens]
MGGPSEKQRIPMHYPAPDPYICLRHSILGTHVVDVQDVFWAEIPSDLSSIGRIEHHIDLNPGATFLNRPTYRNKPSSWEECLPHLKFAYNRNVQSTSYSLFEKIEFVRELHAKVRANSEKRNGQYATEANKGHVIFTFEPGDCVWVHR